MDCGYHDHITVISRSYHDVHVLQDHLVITEISQYFI